MSDLLNSDNTWNLTSRVRVTGHFSRAEEESGSTLILDSKETGRSAQTSKLCLVRTPQEYVFLSRVAWS